MSDSTGVASAIDTEKLLDDLDYEDLFEGTALAGVESEDGSLAEAIGRRLGEIAGRLVGEALGGWLGALLLPALIETDETSDAVEEGNEESDTSEDEDGSAARDTDGGDGEE